MSSRKEYIGLKWVMSILNVCAFIAHCILQRSLAYYGVTCAIFKPKIKKKKKKLTALQIYIYIYIYILYITIKLFPSLIKCSMSCEIEWFNWIMVKIQLSFKYSEFHVNYFTIFSFIITLSTDVTKS